MGHLAENMADILALLKKRIGEFAAFIQKLIEELESDLAERKHDNSKETGH